MKVVDLYRCIAESLVEFPEQLEVSEKVTDRGPIPGYVVASAHESDCGKLIGVRGQNFKACEDLLQACALKSRNGDRAYLKIVEKKSEPGFLKRYEPKRDWGVEDEKRLLAITHKITGAVIHGNPCVESRNLPKGITVLWIRSPACSSLHERIKESLETILRAIGRNRGRIVHVQFTA
jgi:predicted RNA-binding protein YlqC (UPF0109 family)